MGAFSFPSSALRGRPTGSHTNLFLPFAYPPSLSLVPHTAHSISAYAPRMGKQSRVLAHVLGAWLVPPKGHSSRTNVNVARHEQPHTLSSGDCIAFISNVGQRHARLEMAAFIWSAWAFMRFVVARMGWCQFVPIHPPNNGT